MNYSDYIHYAHEETDPDAKPGDFSSVWKIFIIFGSGH